MQQVARNAVDPIDGFLRDKKCRVLPRDTKFDAAFGGILNNPELRWREVFFGEDMLRRTLREFVAHYHDERPHQAKGNVVLRATPPMPTSGPVLRRERLGGLLSYYHRHRRAS